MASVKEGKIHTVEITPDALKSYMDMRLGSDYRIAEFWYSSMARRLRGLGFSNLGQVDECIKDLNDDTISRIATGGRQGQMNRFELLLLVLKN